MIKLAQEIFCFDSKKNTKNKKIKDIRYAGVCVSEFAVSFSLSRSHLSSNRIENRFRGKKFVIFTPRCIIAIQLQDFWEIRHNFSFFFPSKRQIFL